MKTEVLGVPFDVLTMQESAEKAMNYILHSRKTVKSRAIFTPNPEMVMLARKDSEYMKTLKSADMLIPDGIGVVYASKLNKIKLKERVPGYDLVQDLFEKMKDTDKTVYFFGGAPGIAEKAAVAMREKYKGLKIVGTSDGYFDAEKEKLIKQEIKELKPDLLLVGLGFPKQEKWIISNRNSLPVNLMIGVGGSFDGMSGNVKRAPKLFRKLGLEWFYRLIKQPSRIKRQLVLPHFVFVVLANKLFGKK